MTAVAVRAEQSLLQGHGNHGLQPVGPQVRFPGHRPPLGDTVVGELAPGSPSLPVRRRCQPEPSLRRALAACQQAGALAATRLWARAEGLRSGLGTCSSGRTAGLTASGYPFELGFLSGEANPRLTAEVGSGRLAPERRLAAALAWAAGVSRRSERWPFPRPADLVAVHAGRELHFGALLGWRERQGRIVPKIYAEVPRGSPAAADLVRAEFGSQPLLIGREAELVLLGLEPRSAQREHYFEAPQLEAWQLERLLGRLGLSDRAGQLFAGLEQLCQRSCERRLPWGNVGFSIGLSRRVLTVFAPSRTLLGNDQRTRERLLSVGAWLGQDLSCYAAASAPLADAGEHPRCHGLLGLVVAPEGLRLWIALQPPPVALHSTGSVSGPEAAHSATSGAALEPDISARPRPTPFQASKANALNERQP